MTRSPRSLPAAATLALASALVGDPAQGQQLPADARASSWVTTVTVEPPPRASARPLTTGAIPPAPAPRPDGTLTGRSHALDGIASFYWQEQMTASGERFDRTAMTAAHRTLPFNSRVRVTNLANGRAVVVRINDRGPFKAGRVIDLSWAAAGEIDMRAKGLTKVKVEVLELGPERSPRRAARR